ncbi:MAG: phosphoglucomutase/phosphomannomutase family protein [Clostridiales bacterium]|nr:phosphoglucomutase/phosphomannomutase family protein [Clostridiales bacterium]
MVKFGTGGFRGVIGDDFNRDNVKLVAQGLCDIIKAHEYLPRVVVGYDYRFGSDYFAGWIAETLAANDITCLLYNEPMPSPAVMTAVRDEKLDFGFMITASHNPYYFNGVKLFIKGGMDADVATTNALERAINSADTPLHITLDEGKAKGLIVDYNNKKQYLENIKSFLSPKLFGSKIKILYDNLNGVGARCIEPMFQMAGIENFKIMNVQHDAFFNFSPPNPTEAAMEPLKSHVVQYGFDFAMATDSDSDRLGIIDEKGNYVSSNFILACLYYYLLKYRGMKGDIVKNCATTTLVDMIAARAGYKCHEVDVGFKNISSKIREVDALIGGESSGGLTVRGYIFGKDSVFSSLLFTEMVALMGKPVSEIVKEVCDYAGYNGVCIEDEMRFADGVIRIPDGMPEFSLDIVRIEEYNNNIKYHFGNGQWALIRKSGTEPVVRLFVECNSATAARVNSRKLREFLTSGKGKNK